MKYLLFLLATLAFIGECGKKTDRYPTGPSSDKEPTFRVFPNTITTVYLTWFFSALAFCVMYVLARTVMSMGGSEGKGHSAEGMKGIELTSTKADASDSRPSFIRNSNRSTERVMTIPGTDTEVTLVADPRLHYWGYHSWWFGTFSKYFGLYSLLLWCLTMFVTILSDYYWDCDTITSIDNQCYYGSYPITGSWSGLTPNIPEEWDPPTYWIFFYFWLITVGVSGILITLKGQVLNLFRQPVSLAEADNVYIWVYDEQEILCVDPGCCVSVGRWVADCLKNVCGKDDPGHGTTCQVCTMTVSGQMFRYVEFDFIQYIIENGKLFRMEVKLPERLAELSAKAEPLDHDSAVARRKLVGENTIAYRVQSFCELIEDEFYSLFFLYQWGVYMVWFYWSYLLTAAACFMVVLGSAATSIWVTVSGQVIIQQLTEQSSQELVKRKDSKGNVRDMEIQSKQLVPGDIIRIKPNFEAERWEVPCDIVLLKGTAVCDESGLTGESMPIAKVVVDSTSDATYGGHGSSRHMLYAGTHVLQAGSSPDDEVLGVVAKTGIQTSKGELVAHILHPSQMLFKYDEEYNVAFVLLFFYGICCFMATYVLKVVVAGSNASVVVAFLQGIFTMSQMLSPFLPLSLVVGQVKSSSRLMEENDIFCVQPKRIAICGKVRLAAFDKTGTLTKEGLDFLGVCRMENFGQVYSVDQVKEDKVIMRGLATCHAVSKFKNSYVGNQVEVKMFQETGWELDESGKCPVVTGDGNRLEIPKRYEFDHGLMRMSTISTVNGQDPCVYTKGSAEAVQKLCKSVPENFMRVAQEKAKDGCYVLGLCRRAVPQGVDFVNWKRDEAEAVGEFECLGLIMFRNELKEDTAEAIGLLRDGNVRTIMITGDNAQCGYYISKQCGMINPDVKLWLAENKKGNFTWTLQNPGTNEVMVTQKFPQELIEDTTVEVAMTGRAYEALKVSGEYRNLITKTRIYARMSPTQKQEVVEGLISHGLVVAYCGDGGNDCGALRAAHAGVALSEAEASVVSPFTGNSKSVMSMVDLLREGRCALATSFANWKFIILFGQCYAITKLSLVYYDAIMPPLDYLFIDLLVLVCYTVALTFSRPMEVLGKERPTAALMGPYTILSIMGPFVIWLIFLLIGWGMLKAEEEYIKWPLKCTDGGSWWLMGDNWECAYAFTMFIFQMVQSGWYYGLGGRFRKNICYNYFLNFVTVLWWTVFSLLLLTDESSFIRNFHFPQQNFNEYGTVSTSWNYYQNINKYGLPWKGAASCAWITQSGVNPATGEVIPVEPHWAKLYDTTAVDSATGLHTTLITVADDALLAPVDQQYEPGRPDSYQYDLCLHNACQAKKSGCNCGSLMDSDGNKLTDDDGKFRFAKLSSEYGWTSDLRMKIFLLVLGCQAVTTLFVSNCVDGFGRDLIPVETREKSDFIKLDL